MGRGNQLRDTGGSLAVGSSSFVKRIQPLILTRRETAIVQSEENLWVLKEAPVPYGQETGLKNGRKPLK